MKQTDEYYMKCAIAEAKEALREDEVPIGAVIVSGDRIIARSHNQTERLNDPTAHAEMLAITAATNSLGAKYLTDCRLYVTVEPCVMCAGAIAWSQLSAIVYGAPDEKRGYTRFAPDVLLPKIQVVSGIMADECSTLMKDFFLKKR
ncbi:MAG: nucleoside deaminase [Tannerella sp.]|jgi:tRNA(adenine34) deaminase|nr:nucleoside deaminase [Tannerella sp.]